MRKLKTIFICIGILLLALAVNFGANIIASRALLTWFVRSEGGAITQERMQQVLFNPDFLMLLTLIATCAIGALFATWYRIVFSKTQRTSATMVYNPKTMIVIVLIGLFLQIACSALLTLILPLFENTMQEYSKIMSSLVDGSIWISILATVVVAPIAEECLFRGVILRQAQKALPFAAANILQALLFGVYHLNIVQGIYAFLFGLVFGYVAYRCKRIIPAIIMHASVNLSSFVIGYLIPDSWDTTSMMIVMGAAGSGLVIFLCTRIPEVPLIQSGEA